MKFLEEKLEKQYGKKITKEITEGYQTKRKTTLRINTIKSNIEEIKKELEKEKILDKEEKGNARNMLVAAAFTYVASVLSTLLQIFRLVLISSSSDRRH